MPWLSTYIITALETPQRPTPDMKITIYGLEC